MGEINSTLTETEFFRFFQQFGQGIRRTLGSQRLLQDAVDALGKQFKLDRCLILLIHEEHIELKAEFHIDSLDAIGFRTYQNRSNSEWYRLLSEGKPVPFNEISLECGKAGDGAELGQLVKDSQSLSLIAFPLLSNERLLGFLSMHFCRQAVSFSDQLLEAGEALGEELALAIAHSQLLERRDLPRSGFDDVAPPLLIFEPESYRIVEANAAAQNLFPGLKRAVGQSLLSELLTVSDSARLKDALRLLGPSQSSITVPEMLIRNSDGGLLDLDAFLTSHRGNGDMVYLLTLFPHPKQSKPGSNSRAETPGGGATKVEDMAATLSKQLNWERVARHIISMLHASLDRDVILQTTVDSLGRALGVSFCLVVRTDTQVSPAVTHEYVKFDWSPLGLGRASQFPQNAIGCFKNKLTAISDLTCDPLLPGMTDQDLEELLDNNIRALLGCPIAHHGVTHGALILIQTERPRLWNAQEIELVEIVAEQAAVALNHAQAYNGIKDQLFNVNLIGNLTQQLTNALDSANRNARPDPSSEAPKQPGPSPLSLRELEVLKLIASGLANREIAQRLFLTESTVELHASRIRKKLKLKSRTALVKYACDNHLV